MATLRPAQPHRVPLFGVHIDPLDMAAAVATVLRWVDERRASGPGVGSGKWEVGSEKYAPLPASFSPPTSNFQFPCRYVVTPNVDHTVILQSHGGLRAAYRDAGLVLADGWPVVAASRLVGRPLPERVPGSDLVPRLFDAGRPLRVFLLGAAPGVADRAAARIQTRWPNVQVVGAYSPPLGFERNDSENARILHTVSMASPDVLVVGLGAPKQELWVHQHRARIAAPVALCVGATIDFLAGEKARAPRWLQRLGLEWLHRMLSEPRRLLKRYLRDAWIFPQLVWREFAQR